MGPGVDDVDGGPCRDGVECGVVGAVVVGEDDDPATGEDAEAVEIGANGAGEHCARAVVVGGHCGAFDGARPGSYHWSTTLTVGKPGDHPRPDFWRYTVFLSDPHLVANAGSLYDHEVAPDDVTIDYVGPPYFVIQKLGLTYTRRESERGCPALNCAARISGDGGF